jgi:FkbM family methyltransferase
MMKLFFKTLAKFFINLVLASFPKTIIGRYIHQEMVMRIMSRSEEIVHCGHKLRFSVPNRLNDYRIQTFATKEPATLEWIENIPPGSVLWDVGANIGLYSIYAAMAQKCKVFAFEPSVFNLELLARNIALNNLQESVCIVPIALSDNIGTSMFKMSNTEWGGALSTFGQSFNQDGEELRQVFEYQTLGLSMDDARVLLKIPQPQYLKMDVDGIEHFILRGGMNTLSQVESVLIEINDVFVHQAEESTDILKRSGLVLHRKCDLGVPNQYNQWWIRPTQVLGN